MHKPGSLAKPLRFGKPRWSTIFTLLLTTLASAGLVSTIDAYHKPRPDYSAAITEAALFVLFLVLYLLFFGYRRRTHRKVGSFLYIADRDNNDRDRPRVQRTIERLGLSSPFQETTEVITPTGVIKDSGQFAAKSRQLWIDVSYALRRSHQNTPVNIVNNTAWELGVGLGLHLDVQPSRLYIWYLVETPKHQGSGPPSDPTSAGPQPSALENTLTDAIHGADLVGVGGKYEPCSVLEIERQVASSNGDNNEQEPTIVLEISQPGITVNSAGSNKGHAKLGVLNRESLPMSVNGSNLISPTCFSQIARSCASLILEHVAQSNQPLNVYARIPTPLSAAIGFALQHNGANVDTDKIEAQLRLMHFVPRRYFDAWSLAPQKMSPSQHAEPSKAESPPDVGPTLDRLINLTPHTVRVLDDHDEPILEIPPSGEFARLEETAAPDSDLKLDNSTLRHRSIKYGEIVALPDLQPGVGYVVSRVLAASCAHRIDVFFPDEEVRNQDQQIVGCRGLGSFHG